MIGAFSTYRQRSSDLGTVRICYIASSTFGYLASPEASLALTLL
jgi:hypothetical protein